MEILGVEKFGAALFQPFGAGQRLAFWTMPIGARVVRVALDGRTGRTLEMAAESSSAAEFDGRHHAALRRRQRSAVLQTIGGAVAAEHIRHFELGTIHVPGAQKC